MFFLITFYDVSKYNNYGFLSSCLKEAPKVSNLFFQDASRSFLTRCDEKEFCMCVISNTTTSIVEESGKKVWALLSAESQPLAQAAAAAASLLSFAQQLL